MSWRPIYVYMIFFWSCILFCTCVILFVANAMNAFILALVETLVAKTRAWEESRGLSFMYDGVPLLAMLDEYVMLREEREEDKKRMKVCSSLLNWKPMLSQFKMPLNCRLNYIWVSLVCGQCLEYADCLVSTI